MSENQQSFVSPLNEVTRRRLADMHKYLLRLHKVLLDDERLEYEKSHGRVETSGQMLNLVMFDPYFDWLHRISEMIVQIDELTENEEATLDDAYKLIAQARALFRTEPDANEFARRYRAALQREPDAVLAHADVQKVLFTDS